MTARDPFQPVAKSLLQGIELPLQSRIIPVLLALVLLSACSPDVGCSRANYAENKSDIEELESRLEDDSLCANLSIGRLYLYGSDVVEVDIERGLDHLKHAADGGLSTASWELALFHLFGESGYVSVERGTHYLKLSAKQEYVPAQTLFGQMLVEGSVIEQDRELGITWLRRAAANGGKQAEDLLSELDN